MSLVLRLWLIHLILVFALFWGIYSLGAMPKPFFVSFLSMSALMNLNLLAILWSFNKIFSKKSIALPALVIVFKWLVVGALLFLFIGEWNMDVRGILLGALTFVFPLFYFVFDRGTK